MTKLSKKFVSLGLRREKNLADVENSELALNGLLNDLGGSDPDPSKSFISQDLDAIRGLQNTIITSEKLSILSNITVTATVSGQILPSEVTPLVRIVDRLENIKIVTGEIPAIQGGDGLTATFIPSGGILPGSSTSTGDTIFAYPVEPITEVFWDTGYFNLPSFIDPTFDDQYGGIQWEGYFTPSLRDPNVRITVITTGLVMFETDLLDNGSWQTLLNIYADERTIPVSSVESGNTVFVIGADNVKFVSVDDIVDEGNSITVAEVGSDRITLSAPYVNPPGQITVKKVLGTTVTRNIVNLPTLEVGKRIKIRISYWYPDNGEDLLEKYLEFNYIGSSLNYPYLYSQKPSDILEPFEIRQALTDVLSPYQNQIGTSLANKNFYVDNSLLVKYEPTVSTLTNIRKAGPGNVTFSLGSDVITGSVLSNAEKGSIIAPPSALVSQ